MEIDIIRFCSRCRCSLAPGSVDTLCPRCLLEQAAKPTELMAQEPGALPAEERDFGDFELLERIAQGGMGVVYKARQKSLDRIVAIKLLLLGPLANEDYLKRFRFEAVAAGSLRHPNIVHIHEVGLRDGQPFIVMEYVDGQNLSKLVGGRPLAAKRAASYLKTIAEAIHAAHESGILHRDLKPSNVMIDFLDQPRVTDFGLAKRLESDSELTLSGQMLGTPNYLPPEQASSKRGKVGRASDVYGLGAIFYHLLTGRPPQAGETVAETLQQALHVEPVKPRLLNPSVPVDAETICLKCLEKEPGKRYGTAAALAEDLGRFLDGDPIVARPIGPMEKGLRWCRRHPQLAAALGALVVTLVVGVSGIAWEGRRAALEAARAAQEASNANAKSHEAVQNLYAADMVLAQEAIDGCNFGHALELLRGHARNDGVARRKGWEWRYLWNQLRMDEHNVIGRHTNGATIVRFLPDGRRLASVGLDGQLKVWDVANRRLIHAFGHPDFLHGLAVSEAAPRLASASNDGTVRIWNTDDWSLVRTWDCKESVSAVALSKDAGQCAVAGSRHTFVFDIETGLERRRIDAANNIEWLCGLDFSPDGRWLAMNGRDGAVVVLDANGGGQLRAMAEDEQRTEWRRNNPLGLAFSPDSRTLVGTYYSTVRAQPQRSIDVWDVATGRLVSVAGGHHGFVGQGAFSPDGRIFATPGNDQTIRLWHTDSWAPAGMFRGHTFQVFSVHFSFDGRFLASASKDDTVRVWNMAHLRTSTEAFIETPDRNPLRISPDGTALLARSAAGVLSVFGTDNLRPLPEHSVAATNRVAAIGPRGDQVAWQDNDRILHLWTFANREEVRLDVGDGLVWKLAFSRKGGLLGAVLNGKTCRVWDLHTLKPVLTTSPHTNSLATLAFSHDETCLALGGKQRVLELWDLARKTHIEVDTGHKDWVAAVAFSPDDRTVLTSGFDQQIGMWGRDGSLISRGFGGELTGFLSLAMTADSTRLVGGGVDGAIVFWDITGASPRQVLRLARDTEDIQELAFVEGTETLVSRSVDAIRIWRAPPVRRIVPGNELPEDAP